MLKFVFGRASSGKTFTVLNMICKCVEEGKEPILIVPEQFSFESEKAILEMLGDSKAFKVLVLPFTRIYETIGRIKGGICGKVLSGADKFILMSRAIKQVEKDLSLWGKYSSSSAFAEGMIRVTDEFKYNAVSATDLRTVADLQSDSKLVQKLNDTALIIDSYEMLLGTNFVDPSDFMDKLYYLLEDCDFFKEKEVFFDGFKSFSGQQFKIIDRILSKADNVTFSFVEDINDNRELSLLSNIRSIEDRIISIAKSHNVEVDNPDFLSETRYNNEGLKAFEECMFTGNFKSDVSMPCVTVCKAESIFDEVEFATRNIRRIIREKNAKYSDFVIIARDTAPYEDALLISCRRNKVKCFIDKKLPLVSMPVSSVVLSAISFAVNGSVNDIFKFHKSGISVLSSDQISELENYVYIWNLSGRDFLRKWDMNTLGFTDKVAENGEEKLTEINSLREKAITPIAEFKKNFEGTPKNRATAIIKLLEDINAKDAFNALYDTYKNSGNEEYAEAMLTSYSDFMSVLDSIIDCFPDVAVTSKDFSDALKNSVNVATIGITPQTLDEAIFGMSDRIRPARPKYVFILGANQGVFPKISAPTGLFSNQEFKTLKDSGLDIPDRTETLAVDEDLLVYSNTCCASDEVYISFTKTLADGSSSSASAFVDEICKNLKVNILNEPDILGDKNLPETLDSALLGYCKSGDFLSGDSKTLKSVLEKTEKAPMLKVIDSDVSASNAKIEKETAKRLYGNSVFMSPTKFDEYNRCKFMYFCKHALKASKLYPADFNVMQRGTLIHFVLQRIIEIYGKNVSLLSQEEISQNVDKLCEEYLDSVKGFKSVENARTKYLVSNMARSLKYVVNRLKLEFSQSDFEPKECELLIGDGGEIPKIKVDLADGNKLMLGGVIDRLDTYKGYVRIVDYKSGSRTFRLPDILFGQNMQMLLYLYTVLKSGAYGNHPAGVLYMGAKRIKDGSPADRRMNGLLVADGDIAYAMDKDNKGEFIPKFNEDKPSNSYLSEDSFGQVFEFIDKKLRAVGEDIFLGKIDANPIDGIDSPACKYCDFLSVCRISNDKIKKVPKLSNDEVLQEIEKGEEADGN